MSMYLMEDGTTKPHDQKIIELTKQRDDWKAKYLQQNKGLGCELRDPNGTIWDYAKKVESELKDLKTWRQFPSVPQTSADVIVVTDSGKLVVARYLGGAWPHWRYEFGELSEKVIRWLPISENVERIHPYQWGRVSLTGLRL